MWNLNFQTFLRNLISTHVDQSFPLVFCSAVPPRACIKCGRLPSVRLLHTCCRRRRRCQSNRSRLALSCLSLLSATHFPENEIGTTKVGLFPDSSDTVELFHHFTTTTTNQKSPSKSPRPLRLIVRTLFDAQRYQSCSFRLGDFSRFRG